MRKLELLEVRPVFALVFAALATSALRQDGRRSDRRHDDHDAREDRNAE